MNSTRRFMLWTLALTFPLLLWTNTDAKEWRGIVPLKSSRADVEQLLGKPAIDRTDFASYHYNTERVSIDYSRGPCSVELSQWNVAKGIVISIWVTPVSKVLFTDLKVDQARFKKLPDYHVGTITHYVGGLW